MSILPEQTSACSRILQLVLDVRVPRHSLIRLWPEVLDRVGTAEFQGDQVIHFVLAGSVVGDAVRGIDLILHGLRHVPNLLAVARNTDVVLGHVQRIAGSAGAIRNQGRPTLALREAPGRKREHETAERRKTIQQTHKLSFDR